MVPHEYVTTAFELPGFRIKRNLGVVRGIVVRSRSIVGTIGADLNGKYWRVRSAGAGSSSAFRS